MIRKRLITLVVSILCVYPAFAQVGLHLGIKGGANLTKIDGQKFKDEFNLNYYGGAFLDLGFSEHFSIQPEVLFAQNSARTESDFNSVYSEFLPVVNDHEMKLNYLNIPLLANIKLSKFFWVQLGPQYGILIDKEKNITQNGKDAFKKGDFSGIGGVWFQFPGGLSLNARYVVGLTEIGDISHQNKWKNQAIQLGIGFRIF